MKLQISVIRNNWDLFIMLIFLIRFPLCLDLCLLGVDMFIICSHSHFTSTALLYSIALLLLRKESYLKLEDLLSLSLFSLGLLKINHWDVPSLEAKWLSLLQLHDLNLCFNWFPYVPLLPNHNVLKTLQHSNAFSIMPHDKYMGQRRVNRAVRD